MHPFNLVLHISPSIEGDAVGLATFESRPTALLPGLILALPVGPEQMAKVSESCSSMFAGWDERWPKNGCDDADIGGKFESANAPPQAFILWSPSEGNVAHSLMAAAFECFPVDRCSGAAGGLLEIMRSYFKLQPPATVIGYHPLHIRLAPWLHASDANDPPVSNCCETTSSV